MTILAETAAAATSTILDSILGLLIGRRHEERRERRKAAKKLLAALTPVVEELRFFESRRRPKRWKKLMKRLYATLDELEPVLPYQWRHLKHSARDSIGNAVGGSVIFVDHLDIPDDTELASWSRWTMHAGDYLDGARRTVRRWGAAPSPRLAKNFVLVDYGTWLRERAL